MSRFPRSIYETKLPQRLSSVPLISGTTKPASAFAAMRYRGYCFWVDDSEWAAKRALQSVTFFFTLTETDTSQRLPLITIPAR